MSEIVYVQHNKKSLAIRADREKYGKLIKGLGARWNSRMKGGPGWLLPLEKESSLKRLIENLQKESEITEIETNKKPRSSQKKFHRAISESSDSASETDKPVKHEEKPREVEKQANVQAEDSSTSSSSTSSSESEDNGDVKQEYYKSFVKKQDKTQEDYESSDGSGDFSSSEGFSTPETPKRNGVNRRNNSDDLYSKMNDLQWKMHELKMQMKK